MHVCVCMCDGHLHVVLYLDLLMFDTSVDYHYAIQHLAIIMFSEH